MEIAKSAKHGQSAPTAANRERFAGRPTEKVNRIVTKLYLKL